MPSIFGSLFAFSITSKIASAEQLASNFSKIENLKVYKTNSNFILCKILNNKITSTELFEFLIKYNILIRDAKDFTFLDNTFFRFCILSENNNKLLIEKLKEVL